MIYGKSIRVAFVAFLIVSMISMVAVAPSLAQSEVETPDVDGEETDVTGLEYSFEGSSLEIINSTWDGSVIEIEIRATEDEEFAITDAGVLSSGGSGQVPFDILEIEADEIREIRFETTEEPVVTVQSGDDLWYSTGDASTITIIQTHPDVRQISWSAIGGFAGGFVATGFVGGVIKRKHQNSYKELTANERKKINKNPVEGILGQLKRKIVNNRLFIGLGICLSVYSMLIIFGLVPSPGGLWSSLNDSQRVVVTVFSVLFVLGMLPGYILIRKFFNPSKEYVLDVNASEIVDSNRGVESGSATAIYSGPPRRVREMDIRGEDKRGKAKTELPGGRGVVVRNFNPVKNEADGTWPGHASDEELVAEQAKIEGNRGLLLDSAKLGKNLLYEVTGISMASDISAARAVDQAMRQSLSSDSEAVDDILNAAADGTRWEDYIHEDDGEIEDGDR